MSLEDERVAHEEESERGRIEAAEAARREIEEERRREEEKRLFALEERTRREQLLRREEEARLEAIKLAEIETARHHAESEARRRMLAQSQDHEQRMAAILHDRAKKRLRLGVVASAALAVGIGVFGLMWIEQTERRVADERATLERETRRLQDERDEKIDDLLREIERSKDSKSGLLKELQGKLHILEEEKRLEGEKVPPPKGPTKPPQKPVKPPLKTEICLKGDPMCDNLGR
jgi:hypothetical protein